jgi:Ca-activated chloride channel family protein
MVSFVTPLALALSALAVPIILLYMLRLRRTELPISSTFLWRQLVRDREANAPWQRLRLSWLLLLQLLILAALVVTLARPFATVKTITSGRIVLMLDASASMNATDVEPNRFAAARKIALDLVDTLGPEDTMTVIRVSAVPEILAAASRDKLVLRDAIRSAEPSDVSADWLAAMTLAAGGAIGVDRLKVVIISDGGLPPDLPPVLGDVLFVPVGEQASNLAISALATGALPGRTPQLFARISNYGTAQTDAILDVWLDGTFDTARRYTVPAGGYVDVSDIELPQAFDTLTAHLTLPTGSTVRDYLSIDNVAYAVRDRSGAGRVLLVTKDNLFLEQVFRSLRGVELFRIDPTENLPQDKFDLYVFDGVLPDRLPDGELLIINPPRGTDFFQLSNELKPAGPITVDPEDPRARNLDVYMKTVNLQAFRVLRGVDWGTVLVQVDGYPLVVAGEVENRQVAILPFDVRYPNTDLALQPAWPILVAELAAWFSPPRITDVGGSLSPGAPVTVRFIQNADEAVVTGPDGQKTTLNPDGSEAVFADTLEPGLYRVDLRKGGQTLKSEEFAVNLFDPNESRIEPQQNITIGATTVSQGRREETARREFWPWVAGIGLALLMLEWWLYRRSLQRVPRSALVGWRTGRISQVGRLRTFFERWPRRKPRRIPRTR